MNLTRMIPSAICLGLVCLLPAGTALAGAGDLTEAETRFTTTDCNDLTNADQVYTMGVARSAEQDFIARYTLNLGEFSATPAVPIVGGPGTAFGRSGGLNSREVEYDVDVTGVFTAGTTTLTLPAPAVRFPGGSEAGTTMTITIDLRDASGPIDLCGVKTRNLAVLANGCAVGGVNNAPTAVDDSVSTNPDVALTIDVLSNDSDPDGDSLTVGSVTQPPNGSVMINLGAQGVTYTPASNFTGTDSFSYTVSDNNGGTDTATVTVTVADVNTVLVANFMNGNSTALNSRVYLWNPSASAGKVTVRVFTLPLKDGTAQELTTTPLDLGTLEAKSALNINLAEDILTPLGISLPYTDNAGNLTLEFTIGEENVQGVAQVFSSSIAFGTYPLQEITSTLNASPTVLVANFMNGNNSFLNSRAYLWNPSDSSGKITARAYTLPRSGASTLLGVVDLGLLEAKSARNIKIAEDILSALGLPLPYVADGGNLTVEFTVEAKSVQGVAQVFSSNLAFGTYPLSHSVAMME